MDRNRPAFSVFGPWSWSSFLHGANENEEYDEEYDESAPPSGGALSLRSWLWDCGYARRRLQTKIEPDTASPPSIAKVPGSGTSCGGKRNARLWMRTCLP
jgi:hypothetical protein